MRAPRSAAARRHASLLVAQEVRRLQSRTNLTAIERAEVATVLRRLTARLVLTPLTAWNGDQRVAADFLGLPNRSGKGAA
ncbi:hypothetical protein [Streptomyces hydrogenans]|uniref:hypothetical protein n=1 Tax=Streptomyces hydrogenans TaxID=1873719 RepID=UPI0035DE0A14